MQPIHIFRSGVHTDAAGNTHKFSGETLRSIAESYDPGTSEAPMVIGHPKTDDPAYGWIQRLEYRGDDAGDGEGLWAHPHQVAEEFEDVAEKGHYKKRSASFYGPGHPNNPTPDRFYLRHVGFLGATPPAVKGLKALGFADDANTIEFQVSGYELSTVASLWRNLREWLLTTQDRQTADQVVPDYAISDLERAAERTIVEDIQTETESIPTPPAVGFGEQDNPTEEVNTMTPEEIAKAKEDHDAQVAALADQQKAFAKQQAQFAEQQKEAAEIAKRNADQLREARHQTHLARAQALVASGHLVADHADRLTAIVDSIDANATFEFGEGDEKKTLSVAEEVFALLQSQPKVGPDTREYSSADRSVDNLTDEEMGEKIRDYREEQVSKGREISFTQARREIMRGNSH